MIRLGFMALAVLMFPLAGADRSAGQGSTRLHDVVYGHKYGMGLTMDVWMLHAAADPPGTMRPPVAAVPGTTSYYAGARAVNLSHYSTTCLDPSNPRLLWTCKAYGHSTTDKEWCTAWAAFRLAEREP
ncbi:MAG TPA: hypothetical protein VFV87_03885 [Pirellulaceae bacterium]|nr:hypothetical protein [Pirellulaceae bacterium]